MKKTAIALLAWFVSSASLAATPWQKITHPVPGAAQSIGSFANGCIIGADTLPVQSDNYQVMRTDQRRYFGHPDLVMFIQRLSHQAQQRGLGTVLIGDMGMPAGGRFNGGHASHQTGLDVDIFLQLPKTRWSQAQLLRPQALDLVSRDGKHVVPSRWSSDIASLIKLAAQDNDVTRIFAIRLLNNSFASMPETIVTGYVKYAPGSSIARICTCVYAALPTAWSAKINLYPRRAMDAALNCKAGSNRQNLAPQSLRRRHRRRCRLPARRYWMSMYSDGQFL
ncbi:penicillin-insensitive murein endopeptidase [Salmonella enterica subsp. enterica serovar Enteritidis str. 607307-2]|nr:penicillin-insensitive murein endopeptidase [Salmonella enterica subsp. enterica serovar Enteritidis str. 607307-2]